MTHFSSVRGNSQKLRQIRGSEVTTEQAQETVKSLNVRKKNFFEWKHYLITSEDPKRLQTRIENMPLDFVTKKSQLIDDSKTASMTITAITTASTFWTIQQRYFITSTENTVQTPWTWEYTQIYSWLAPVSMRFKECNSFQQTLKESVNYGIV